jgi:hypothetical protein
LALLLAFGDVGLPARNAPLLSLVRSAAPARPSFTKSQRYPVVPGPYGVAIGDLNGDGRSDLVTTSQVGSRDASYVSVLLNRDGNSFTSRRAYRIGRQPLAVAIGDLDGDGKPDLATANLFDNTVSVLMNRGGGRFAAARQDYPARARPWDIASADLNGDGNADLVIASSNDTPDLGVVNQVSVFISRGDGTLDDRVDYRGRRPVSVAPADLNRDGKLDLVTANLSDSVSVFLNRGDGTFKNRIDYRAGSGPLSIAVGDLNGDRRPDLVTANHNTVTGNYNFDRVDGVSVLLGNGDGTFRAKRDYVDTNVIHDSLEFHSVAVGDLNGDGKTDVEVGDRRTISVFVNRGNGRFLPRLDYGTGESEIGAGARSLALGDLNGDRKPDLVVTKARTVAVLFNTTKR